MNIFLEQIKYWRESAKEDLGAAETLFLAKKFDHCLFFLHLSIEKTLKGLIVQNIKDSAPFIHDLVKLYEKSGISINKEVKLQLAEISTFNISARYDDFKLIFYKKANKEYTTQWFSIGKRLFDFFQKQYVK